MSENPDFPIAAYPILIKDIRFLDYHISVVSMAEADGFLRQLTKEISPFGFTKINYNITWENEKWYRGFYPLRISDARNEKILSVHLALELLNKGGVVKPSRLSMEEWLQLLEDKHKKYPNYSEFAKKIFLHYERT